MGTNMAETSVIEFYYKSVNLSLEELKNIKIILFLIQEPDGQISRNKSLFKQPGRHVNAASRKSLEIQA